jgi:hypothetical protein
MLKKRSSNAKVQLLIVVLLVFAYPFGFILMWVEKPWTKNTRIFLSLPAMLATLATWLSLVNFILPGGLF